MTLWEKFVRCLLTKGPTPGFFSWLHIVSMVLVVGLSVAIVFINKKINDKGYRITVLMFWITFVVFEVFKQITLSHYIDANNVLHYKYDWYQFPFQFCSTPYYLLPFIVFMKDHWFKKRLELFATSFFIIGGIVGVFIPSFCDITWINYQSIIHHGSMIVVSVLIGIRNSKEFVFYKWLQSLAYFGALLAIAMALNAIIPACRPEAVSQGFNMWFISWHAAPNIPVVKDIWNKLPYGVYLTLYIIIVPTISFGVYSIYSACLNHRVDFSINKKQELMVAKRIKQKQNAKH